MEFNRKDIHTSVLCASRYSQLTIDDDFNIPDTKGDIDKIIAKSGYVVLEEISTEEGRVNVTGMVYFKALYKTTGDKAELEVYESEIPFEDHVNVDGINRSNQADCQCRLEDLTVTMINSRKLEVRGLIGNAVSVYENVSTNAATDLENGQGIECQYRDAVITETRISKHDLFKIKEEIEIPQNKPNISEIMWSEISLRNMECKAQDDKINVRGEVEIFIIYRGQEEHLPIQYLFSVRAISKEVECIGAEEGMILEAELSLGKGDVSVRPDTDGEERVIAVDYGVDMNIKLYEDMDVRLLSDLYSPQVEITPKREGFYYENLLMRNLAKTKITHRKRIVDEQAKLLQICHVYGCVEVDDVTIHENHVDTSGVVKASVLYVSADDEPMSCMEVDIPFEYTVDTVTLSPDASVRIVPSLDQLSANLLNSEEVEIKAQVNLGISIFTRTDTSVIVDMTVEPIDYKKKAAMPGIVGYVVAPGDTIWSIARKYYATTESIREINHLDNDYIKEGDRLLIVKS